MRINVRFRLIIENLYNIIITYDIINIKIFYYITRSVIFLEPSQVWQIVVLIILLILSGFFSMSETALMSLSKIRIRHMVEDGVKGAKLVEKLTQDPNKLLGAILIGNNIVNILASSLATTLFVSIVGPSGVGIATGVMTVLVLIFGEITPKSIAKQKSEAVSLKVSKQ